MNATRLPLAGERQAHDTGSAVGQVFVLDRVRIEVALEARSRYKYVSPRVEREGLGWRVVSPNCSRNVSREGGDILIAWLVPTLNPAAPTPAAEVSASAATAWSLYARDHAQQAWALKLQAPSLDEALACLVRDEQREFWV
jgi:hypothetical protein